jgi:hypothetical protein
LCQFKQTGKRRIQKSDPQQWKQYR